ncbi:hypothetical protein RI367_002870 [Sorochytrium milnesiophthora]
MQESDMLAAFKQIVPKLSQGAHKGQAGRVCVFGGSEEYTGAPYFGAITALKLGADLAHVVCDTSAAPVIKSYSPELIVHPYLRTTMFSDKYFPLDQKDSIEQSCALLDRMHGAIFGPGMGRDKLMMATCRAILLGIKERDLPVVIDARLSEQDGLFLVQQEPSLIKGYSKAVLTPNPVEFKRLCSAVGIPEDSKAADLANALDGPVIVQKGEQDTIAHRIDVATCQTKGGRRRFGGQGDVLSGAIATFTAWVHLSQEYACCFP